MIPSSNEVQSLKLAISNGKSKLRSFLSSGSVSKLPEHVLNLQKELVKKYGMLEDLVLAREGGKLLKDPHLYNLHGERLEYALYKDVYRGIFKYFRAEISKSGVKPIARKRLNDTLLTFFPA